MMVMMIMRNIVIIIIFCICSINHHIHCSTVYENFAKNVFLFPLKMFPSNTEQHLSVMSGKIKIANSSIGRWFSARYFDTTFLA